MLGIIVAMQEELDNFLRIMEIETIENKLQTDIYIGKLFDLKIIIARSGIGKVNAAACAQFMIDNYKVDWMINIGVGGAINSKLKIGDIVVSTDLLQHDFDTTIFGDKLGTIPRMKKSSFDSSQKIIEPLKSFVEQTYHDKIYFGRITSSDKFISDSHQKKNDIRHFFKLLRRHGGGSNSSCVLFKQDRICGTKNYFR